MGVVTIGTITQVIEWGKLATFVLFDTRITARSKEPSLKSSSKCCTFVRIVSSLCYFQIRSRSLFALALLRLWRLWYFCADLSQLHRVDDGGNGCRYGAPDACHQC
jgi:hypothetical protein